MKPPHLVLLVGAPRSGTTWLQHLLGAHPAVVTSQETNVFGQASYVGGLAKRWRRDLSEARVRRHKGLPAILTGEQFVELMRDLVGAIYSASLERKPAASIALDKTPAHARDLATALAVVPDAHVIHLLRDGRDVACSLMRVSVRDRGSGWATGRAGEAAGRWREYVEAAREGRELTERYVEVRYEELQSDDAQRVLTDLYAFSGLDPDVELAREILQRFDLERTRPLPADEQPSSNVWGGEIVRRFGDRPEEPEGFFGAARVGGWRNRLDAYERIAFDRVAGDLLVELGYEPGSSWVGVGATGRAFARTAHPPKRVVRRLRRAARGPA